MMRAQTRATTAVITLLEAQHKALLIGDLERLGKMEAELPKAFARLERDGGTLEALLQIKQTAARNAQLLTAAQAGVAVARGQLSAARSPGLTTYDAQGRALANGRSPSRDLARR